MSDITQRQKEVLNEFALLNENEEMLLLYLVRVGKELSKFGEVDRSERNILKGCNATVWLDSKQEGSKMHFVADSNTAITRGLISLLLRIYQGQRPEDILQSELFFIRQSNLSRFIGSAHSNGFATIDLEIRERAKRCCLADA